MNRTFEIATIAMLLTLMFAACAYANSVGVSYSQILDERSWGITGDYQSPIGERINFEADATLQGGDVYNGTINTDFTFDIATVDLKLLISNKIKGYALDTLGRSQSVGLAFTLPVDEKVSVDVGIGGASSSPFSAPTAYDTLTGAGFAETDIDGKGLDTITPKATGIPFKNGNTLNAFVATGFEMGIFEVDVKGVLELLGEGDRMNQVNTTFKTSGKISDINLITAIEIGLASYRDVIYRELAAITTIGIDF